MADAEPKLQSFDPLTETSILGSMPIIGRHRVFERGDG
jgi:hypothetical protein